MPLLLSSAPEFESPGRQDAPRAQARFEGSVSCICRKRPYRNRILETSSSQARPRTCSRKCASGSSAVENAPSPTLPKIRAVPLCSWAQTLVLGLVLRDAAQDLGFGNARYKLLCLGVRKSGQSHGRRVC